MAYYDAMLEKLGAQMARMRQLDAEIKSLNEQRHELEKRIADLDWHKDREQQDVNRLEGRSLAKLFYHLTGRLEEKLTQERAEALAAAVKCEAAQKELAAVEAQLTRLSSEACALRGCEERYQALLDAKADALRASGGEAAERMLALEQRIAALENDRKEIDEAIRVGWQAHVTANEILDHLNSAEGFGVWDMLGGDLIADIAKHGHLDDAQELVEQLQITLRRFKTELADVAIENDMQVRIDGFLHFADYFFDGLFADWAVMDKIGRAKEQAEAVASQIERVLARLEIMNEQVEAKRQRAREDIDLLVRGTAL